MAHDSNETGADAAENEQLRETNRQEIKDARDRGDMSRRDLMKAGGLAGLTALVGAGGLAASTGTAAAASGSNEEVRLYLDTSQNVSGSTDIVLDGEAYDPNDNYDPTTGAYTAPAPGVYFVQWHPTLANVPDGTKVSPNVLVNGATKAQQLHTAGANDYITAHAITTVDLQEGDTIEFNVFHDASSAQTLVGNPHHTYATVHQLGGGGGGGGSGAIEVEDNGDDVSTSVSTLNVGSNLTAKNDGGGQVTVQAASDANAINPYHEPDHTFWNVPAKRPMISTQHKTYYVSADGSDANGGESRDDPLATLEEVGDRLPYLLVHGLDVVIMSNEDGPATKDTGGIAWPPMRCNFAGSESDIDIYAQGSDPDNHLIDSRGLSFSIRGQEPSAVAFKGLKFDTRPQNYNGLAWFRDCVFLSDTDDPSQDMALGGYVGKNYFLNCTFGGDVNHLSKWNQGHEFVVWNCDGTIGDAIIDNGGVTCPTLYLVDGNGSDDLTYDGYVSDPDAPGFVVHNGVQKHPSIEANTLKNPEE